MISTSISIFRTENFYSRIVLQLLSRMPHGRLELNMCDGSQMVFGGEPGASACIHIKNNSFFRKCVLFGDVGFGESFVDGDWDSPDPSQVVSWFISNLQYSEVISGARKRSGLLNLFAFLNRLKHSSRANTERGSSKNISEHYDLSNSFFSLFLDASLSYSSALYRTPAMSLEDAQMAKYERLCSRLKLKSSDEVLEIGTGWGANAIYIARTYGCKVCTTTISQQQYDYVINKVKEEELEDRIKVLQQDYRLLTGRFDKIVSIEMLEAVGAEYYPAFFAKCDALLKEGGLLGIQVITCPDSRFQSLRKGVDWIQKHIFPGSLLPSVSALNAAANSVSELSIVDLKEFGGDYARTLHEWKKQFENKSDAIRALGFDETFIRKWRYYFSYCEAAFANRNIYVMQMVYSRPNNPGH